MFDPTQPANNSALSSAVMRSQLTSLKALVDALVGITGAQVDNVSTLPSGDPAAVNVSLIGTILHFGFGIPQGAQGQPGPPLATVIIDGVTTLNPGDPATVTASLIGSDVHLTFGIPRGDTGTQGDPGTQGPPGEVTNAQLTSAIASTALNPSGISPLNISFSDPPTQAELLQVQDKLNELLTAVKRP